MAGYENIKDHGFDKRTADERREIAIKAGKASGAARRRKADFRKTLNMLLTAEIESEEWKPVLEALGVECTLESALNMAMIREGLAGNVKAYEAIAKYAGQNGRSDSDLEEQMAKIQLMQAQKEKVKKADPEDLSGNGARDPHDVIIPELWESLMIMSMSIRSSHPVVPEQSPALPAYLVLQRSYPMSQVRSLSCENGIISCARRCTRR